MLQWDTAWRALRDGAGLHGLRFHDLRHTVITELAEMGVADHVLESISGHLSRRMLEHYSHTHPSVASLPSSSTRTSCLHIPVCPHKPSPAQRLSPALGFFSSQCRMTGTRTAPEEAELLADLVNSIIAQGVTWTNRHGETRPVSLDDLLIVAPYNAQVSEIAGRLPGARVGTVDRSRVKKRRSSSTR